MTPSQEEALREIKRINLGCIIVREYVDYTGDGETIVLDMRGPKDAPDQRIVTYRVEPDGKTSYRA